MFKEGATIKKVAIIITPMPSVLYDFKLHFQGFFKADP